MGFAIRVAAKQKSCNGISMGWVASSLKSHTRDGFDDDDDDDDDVDDEEEDDVDDEEEEEDEDVDDDDDPSSSRKPTILAIYIALGYV